MWRNEHPPEAAPATLKIALICALGLILGIWFGVLNRSGLGVDFNQFYSGGRIAGTGHLYDWEALRKVELENGMEVPTGRLPVVLFGYKILTPFPYPVARAIWMACSIAALLMVALFWPGTRRWIMLFALCWSLSAAMVILFGQDVPFWLMFVTAGLLLLQRERPWAAGVAFSLCICKFHLALGIPVMLAAQKRWKTLIAGAIAGAVWIGCCFLIEGRGWVQAYANNSKMPQFSPAPERKCRPFSACFPGSPGRKCGARRRLGGRHPASWMACRDSKDLGMTGAAAVACGVLLGHHSYAGDYTLLIPLSVLTVQREAARPWLKGWAILMLTPVPVLLLVSPKPYLGQVLIAAFIVTAVWAGRPKPFLQKSREALTAA